MDPLQTKASGYTPQVGHNLVCTSDIDTLTNFDNMFFVTQIILCENNIIEKDSFESTIAHELVSTDIHSSWKLHLAM